MRAVREAAPRGERLDVRERLAEPVRRLPELELAHPRRVEHETAAGQEDELAVRRRVPAATVAPDVRGHEQLLAGEAVHERRLPDAGRPEQRGGAAAAEVRAEVVEPLPGDRADGVDRDAEGDRLGGQQRPLDVLRQVALRQHDHRLGAALPGHDEVALQAARVEVVPEGGDEEDDVDVRGDDLLVDLGPGDLAREFRPPREHGVDQAAAERDPVADGRKVGPPARGAPEPRRDLGALLTALGVEVVGAAVLHGDARGDETGRRVRFELRFELVRPAQVVQVQGGTSVAR